MRNISKGLAFKYHHKGEASIEEEFQPARDGVDYVDALNSVYNRLDYVIPIYKSAWIKKRTIQAEEVIKKRNILECTSTFLFTPPKCDMSKRFKLRFTNFIAAKTIGIFQNNIDYF